MPRSLSTFYIGTHILHTLKHCLSQKMVNRVCASMAVFQNSLVGQTFCKRFQPTVKLYQQYAHLLYFKIANIVNIFLDTYNQEQQCRHKNL